MNVASQVEKVLLEQAGCRAGEALVVGVSGGLDSMVLLQVVTALARVHRWKVTVAHYNHRLRGRASGADAAFVRRAAQKAGLPVVVQAGEVRARARQEGVSVEMAARQARHAFLAEAARQAGARKILLAHHADDQVELFFIRLLQGAGPGGLKGMEPVAPSPADASLQLVRPLLGLGRSELESYAAQHHVRHREDLSNATLAPLRNRIRHRLLPLLASWQPGLRQVLLRTMELLRAEDAFLAGELLARQRQPDAPPSHWPLALQRRHLAAELVRQGLAPQFELIEFLRQHPNCPVMVEEGLRVQATAQLTVEKLPPVPSLVHSADRLAMNLASGGQAHWQGVAVAWELCPRRGERPLAAPGLEWFDAEAVGGCVVLRHWQPGDRFWPIGAPAAMKLQDFFVNQKVPVLERRRRLVAEAADGRLFWVEGLRIGEPFKVRPTTRQLLRWAWRRI